MSHIQHVRFITMKSLILFIIFSLCQMTVLSQHFNPID